MKHEKKTRVDKSGVIGLLIMMALMVAAVCIRYAIFLPRYL